jgi:uncharacterized phage protein (TIGR02218 family)
MRDIDPELRARLQSGATRLCRCWSVTRPDGIVMGFTDHDGSLSFDGIDFAASSGLDAGVIERTTGLSVDNGSVVGALASEAISETDILAGRYDAAEVRHWLVDWTDPGLRMLLFTGTLGEVRRGDGVFEAELRGLAEALNRPVGRIVMSQCDRVLGDARCGVEIDSAAYSTATLVVQATGRRGFLVPALDTYAEGWFRRGRLTWLSGANAGLSASIRSDDGEGSQRRILLHEDAKADIAAGDALTLFAGCDKRAATCRTKFGNFLNFRGFPHVPSENWVMAYPARGDQNDGGSLGDEPLGYGR